MIQEGRLASIATSSRASSWRTLVVALVLAVVLLGIFAVLNLPPSSKLEHVTVDSASIAWHPDKWTVSISYHNDGSTAMKLSDIILESYGLAYWKNATVNGIQASQVSKNGISLPAKAAGTLTLLVPASENWPFVVNQTIEVIIVSSLGKYYYTYAEETSDGKTYVILTDGLAGRVCQALLAPCPPNPTFLAVQEGSGQNISYVVTVKVNYIFYTVTLNDTSYSVYPPLP